jgi:hypothetical protein
MNDSHATGTAGEPLDAFVDAAWAEHADAPEAVAARLRGALARLVRPEDVAPLGRLIAHVYGEHLGRFADGIALLDQLAYHPAARDHAEAQTIVARQLLALRFARGDTGVAPHLGLDDAVSVRATAASMLAGLRRFPQALGLFTEALRLAEGAGEDAAGAAGREDLRTDSPQLRQPSPALRALAIAGNNLAAALEQEAGRDAALTAGMVAAAEAALRYWQRVGTWLEEERAEYRLARACLAAGRVEAALQAARRCVAQVETMDAPAFERVFAYAVLADACRAARDNDGFERARADALAAYAALGGDDRRWAADEVAALR